MEGDANQISVIVTDGDFYAEGTKIKKYLVLNIYEQDYYGILPKDGSGQTRLAYFSDFDVSKDRIYLLAERKNGEKETDYASEPFEIGISLKNEKTTSIGTGNINNPYPSGGWDYIYYGEYDPDGDGPKVPIALKHRVLSNDTTEYSADKSVHTMLVDCDNAIKKMNFDSTSLVSNVWADSDAYNWLNISLSGFGEKCFAYGELRGLINHYKGKNAGSDNVTELKGERFFILDVDEATRQSFGYQNKAQRAKNRLTDGASSAWYLRSPDSENTENVKLVANSGNIVSFAVNAQSYYISPAFNIDLSEILYSTLVSGKAGTPGAKYKLTMYSPDYNISLTEGKKTSIDYNVISVPIHVKDNYTSSARFAVMVTDGDFYEKGTKIKYFGYPAVVSDKTYNEHDDWVDGLYWDGYCSFTIPEAYDPVTDKMYIIYERIRGGRQSDFAGKPLEVQLNDPSAIKITKQPQDTTVAVNKTAYFDVEATTTTSPSDLKYLWQYKYAGESTWTDWTTKTTAKIGIAYNAKKNGMSVRCKVTDVNGNTATSNAAVLTYKADSKVTITTQPKNTTVAVNKSAYFSVEATTTASIKKLKYLWQYKYAGESTWTDWTTKTTASIGIAYNANKNGMSVRCKVTDVNGNTATSNAAVLTYKADSKVTITTQPKDTTVAVNKSAYFSVEATTTATSPELQYLWQYKYAGESTWTDWTTKTTARIGIAYNANKNGMSVRCKVTDVNGNTATSNAAVLTYKADSRVAITLQPKDTTVAANKTAYFYVEATTTASPSDLEYLWQYKYAGESTWTDWATKTTAKIGIAYNANKNGMTVRCKVTDVNGNTATSNSAVLSYIGSD